MSGIQPTGTEAVRPGPVPSGHHAYFIGYLSATLNARGLLTAADWEAGLKATAKYLADHEVT